MAEVPVQLESGCHGLNSKDEETETAGTGGELGSTLTCLDYHGGI